MTCIIGACCAEGVAIIADSRITKEYESTINSKFHEFWNRNVIGACAGVNAVIDRFEDVLNEKANDIQPSSFKQVYEIVENSLTEVKSRYVQRMGPENYDIEMLLGGLEGFNTGEPLLKCVDKYGVSENVSKFAVIGHGKQYATTLFTLMYDNMLTLRELALLGCFVITAVTTMGLDQTVGTAALGPEVIVMRADEPPEYFNTTDADFRRTNNVAESLEFKNALVKPIWNNIPQAYSHMAI